MRSIADDGVAALSDPAQLGRPDRLRTRDSAVAPEHQIARTAMVSDIVVG